MNDFQNIQCHKTHIRTQSLCNDQLSAFLRPSLPLNLLHDDPFLRDRVNVKHNFECDPVEKKIATRKSKINQPLPCCSEHRTFNPLPILEVDGRISVDPGKCFIYI